MTRPIAGIADLFGRSEPLVGVLHVPPLPGSPRVSAPFREIRERVRADARALVEGGADGILLENFGDAPFHPGAVLPETVSHMTVLAGDVRTAAPDTPLGINVLRNDALAALAVAEATGGAFIRVNVLAGVRVTDQGLVEGAAHRLLRRRRALDSGVRIFADVDVKHSAPLAPRPLEEEARELVDRAGADVLVVTGGATGEEADPAALSRVVGAAGDVPVFVGSGITSGNAAEFLSECHGIIVGSDLREDGRAGGPVVEARVRAVAAARDRGTGGG